MTCCGHCRDAGDFFNDKTAKRDLRRYKRRGPGKPTRLLVESISQQGVHNHTLLDIGGGIGAIQLGLFKKGLANAVNVDASHAYQAVSKKAIESKGLSDKVVYYYGDFTDIAGSLPEKDIVTLDKVICCYPDAVKLLNESLNKAGRIYALVFPRETIIAKAVFRIGNLWFRFLKSDFRTYLHPVHEVVSIIRSHGFNRQTYRKTFFWHIMTFEKGSKTT